MPNTAYADMVRNLAQGTLHTSRLPANILGGFLVRSLDFSEELDWAKKSLFYDKPNEYIDAFVSQFPANNGPYANVSGELIHAIIGMRTEIDELLYLLLQGMDGQRLDRQKLIDEAGDTLFYLQLFMQAPEVQSSISEAAAANMAKLAKRYPNGFDKAKAHNPDKVAETEAQMEVLQ